MSASLSAVASSTNCWTSTPHRPSARIAHGVEGVGDVLGAERLAVAPGDAGAGLDGQLGVVGVVLVALGQPGDRLVGEGAVEGERLVEETEAVLVVGADGVAVPELVVDVGRLRVLAPAQDQRPVAGNLRDLLRGARRLRSRGTVASNAAGLDDVAPRELRCLEFRTSRVHLHHRCVGVAGTGAARSVWPPLADCRIESPDEGLWRGSWRAPVGLSMTSCAISVQCVARLGSG